MDFNSQVTGGTNNNHPEIVIKINLEDLFHNRQCHPQHDAGEVVYYIFRVDKQQFERKERKMTAQQLLALVGHTPETHRLFELGHGQREIAPNEVVDFSKPGIERFKSVAKHANEGIGATNEVAPSSLIPRRQVCLLSEDSNFLNKHGSFWETIIEAGVGWIIIHDFDIPEGYNISTTKVAFMIPPSYPTIEFDMMYFFPVLNRADGKSINNLSPQIIENKQFQRWSRHRNPGAWRPGIDNLETHFLAVLGWLKDELLK